MGEVNHRARAEAILSVTGSWLEQVDALEMALNQVERETLERAIAYLKGTDAAIYLKELIQEPIQEVLPAAASDADGSQVKHACSPDGLASKPVGSGSSCDPPAATTQTVSTEMPKTFNRWMPWKHGQRVGELGVQDRIFHVYHMMDAWNADAASVAPAETQAEHGYCPECKRSMYLSKPKGRYWCCEYCSKAWTRKEALQDKLNDCRKAQVFLAEKKAKALECAIRTATYRIKRKHEHAEQELLKIEQDLIRKLQALDKQASDDRKPNE